MSYDEPKEGAGSSTKSAPPKLDIELQQVLHRHKGIRPRMFPSNPFEASDLWVSMQEPPKERDRPEWISQSTKVNPNAGGWSCPYIDRVRLNLRIFLSLPEEDQNFVAEMIQSGYSWHGDGMDFYRAVIKNTDIMFSYVDKHGRSDDGLLPQEYTAMIFGEAKRLTQAWDGSLPYDKTERQSGIRTTSRQAYDENER